MTSGELADLFSEWADEQGYEDATATCPVEAGEFVFRTTTVCELARDFVEEGLTLEQIEELGGLDKAVDKVSALGDELGPYWMR